MDTYIEGRLANVTGSRGYILDRNILLIFSYKEFKKKGRGLFKFSKVYKCFYSVKVIISSGTKALLAIPAIQVTSCRLFIITLKNFL